MLDSPKIIWEKWSDPFGKDDTDDTNYFEDIEKETVDDSVKYHKVLLTNMGMIPYNEYTDCSKIFNFWIGHTNFNLSNRIATIIQEVDGVETLDIFTRYRFRVGFGKAFIDREVMNNINTIITSIFNITND
jgi:hypothetical protein